MKLNMTVKDATKRSGLSRSFWYRRLPYHSLECETRREGRVSRIYMTESLYKRILEEHRRNIVRKSERVGRTFSFYLPEILNDYLNEKSRERGVSKNRIAVEILMKHLSEDEK
jgi:hypothetical protein